MILKFFNILFRIVLIFLICFVWARYFVQSLSLALVYTSILTLSIELLIHIFLERKQRKFKLKKEEQSLAEKITANFIYSPEKALSYFYNLGKINYSATKHSKFVVLKRKNEIGELEIKEKTIIFPFYSFSPFSAQNLVEVLSKVKKVDANKIVVCSNKISEDAKLEAKKIQDVKVVLLGSNDVFLKLIKKNNFYPKDLKEISTENKLGFKGFIKLAFSRQRGKGYLLGALVLLFSSFIVKTNIYYVFFSSLLLIFAFVCLFLSPRKNISDEEII